MIQTSNQQKKINYKSFQKYTKSPIVKGYFPKYKSYKEMAIAKVNRFLCVLLGISIFVSFVSYYFVTAYEVDLDKIGREITEIRAQNLELQNQLDNKRSYYNVDKTVKQKNLLQKPQQVLDISPMMNEDTNIRQYVKDVQKIQKDDNFNWAAGF